MKISPLIFYCYLAAWGATTGNGTQKMTPPPSHPNIYLVTIDTLRSDHIRCYGYERIETPALDELAKQGIRFTKAFTPSPITNTSHVSILTGLQPSSHGVSDFGVPLTVEHATLPEILQKQGYQTAAFIGSVILDSKTLAPGLDRGFTYYDSFPQQTETKSRWGRIERRGMDVVERAENWLGAHGAIPQFVWVHLYDPHDPYEPPPPYSEIYKGRLYDGEVAYADSALGHFLAYLKKQNLYEDALIFVLGDHGEGLGEHGEDTHGIFLYDATTHVPLLIKLPNEREASRVVDEQVRTLDVMPTILELLSVPAPTRTDGNSLGPLILGRKEASRTVLGETEYPLRFGWAPLRSIRHEGRKFIEAPRPEFYDLESDPGETRNRYVPWDAMTKKLRGMLREMSSKLPAARKPSPGAISPDTVAELRALGYLGAADARSSTDVPEPSFLPDPKDKIEQQNLLHTAMMASEDGRRDDARAALKKLLKLDNKFSIALTLLGHLEIEAGNYKEAAAYLGQACELGPTDAVAARDYGRALELSGDLPGARNALQRSLKLNPNQFEGRLLLGQVYLKLREPKVAEEEFEAALLLKPAGEEAQVGLAKALLGEKRFSDAVEFLRATTSAASNHAELFELLAEAYRNLGKPEEAQRAEEQANRVRGTKSPR